MTRSKLVFCFLTILTFHSAVSAQKPFQLGRVQSVDTNRDGNIDIYEYRTRLTHLFSSLDTNQSGKIDLPTECKTMKWCANTKSLATSPVSIKEFLRVFDSYFIEVSGSIEKSISSDNYQKLVKIFPKH